MDSSLSDSPSPGSPNSLSAVTPIVLRGNLTDLRRHQRPSPSLAASAPTGRSWRKSVSIVETPRGAPPNGWDGRPRGFSTDSSEEGSVFDTARKRPVGGNTHRTAAATDATTPIRVPLVSFGANNNNNNNINGRLLSMNAAGGKQLPGQSYSRLLELRAERQKKYKYHDWIKSHCRLDLNLQEVAHIR